MSDRGGERWREVAAAGGVLLVAAVACAGAWTTAYTIDDLERYYYPVRAFFAAGLRAGQLRWWCVEAGAGYPLFAEGQMGGAYPPNWIFALPQPGWLALSESVALHLAWAGIGLYACLRQHGATRVAAFAGGLVYMLSGPVWFRLVHLSFLCGLAWLPWFAWGLERAVRGERGGYTTVALTFAAQILAGHPQVPLLSLLLAATSGPVRAGMIHRPAPRDGLATLAVGIACVGLAVAAGVPGARWPALCGGAAGAVCLARLARRPGVACCLRAAGGVVAALAFAGLLTAVQVLPLVELAGQSIRHAHVGAAYATDISLEPAQLSSLLLGRLYGPATAAALGWQRDPFWEWCPHVGIAPLAIFLLAAPAGRRRERWLFWGLAVATLLVAMGHITPFYRWLTALPGFSSVRGPARLLGLYAFGVAMCVGLSIDDLTVHGLPNRGRLALTGALLLAVVLGIGAAVVMIRQVAPALGSEAKAFGGFWIRAGLMISVTALGLLGRSAAPPARAGGWRAVVVAIVAVDLLTAGAGYGQLEPPSYYDAPADPASRGERVLVGAFDQHPYHACRHLLYDGVANFELYNPLPLARWQAVKELIREGAPRGEVAARRWLGLLRIGRVSRELVEPGGVGGLAPAPALGLAPLAWLATDAVLAGSPEQALGLTRQPGWNPRRVAVVETVRAPRPAHGAVRSVRAGRHRVNIELTAAAAGVLVLSQVWYPGWQFRVLGEWRAAEPVNYLLTGLAASDLGGRVDLVYRPMSLRLGLFLSLLGLAVLSGLAARPRR